MAICEVKIDFDKRMSTPKDNKELFKKSEFELEAQEEDFCVK